MTVRLTRTAKTFPDGTRALLPTDLTVEPGEIISLLGPSGCGKTTLLRLIAGLESPDAGSKIRFGDDDVTNVPVEKRHVGMVFQSYALFPNMSVRGNIAYGLKMQKLPQKKIDSRVDEVLQLCRLEAFAQRDTRMLSGGQRQRVALARAFAPRPRLLLLDEPLSALDASLRETLRDELAVLLRRFGITALFVTHDQNEALAIADRVAVMSEGKIAQVGTPEVLYREPRTAFVAGFVGGAMALDGSHDGRSIRLPGGLLELTEPANGRRAFVRAEDISLAADGALSGRVESVTFLGTHYRLGICGVTDSTIYALHNGSHSPVAGETIRVNIAPGDVMLLSD